MATISFLVSNNLLAALAQSETRLDFADDCSAGLGNVHHERAARFFQYLKLARQQSGIEKMPRAILQTFANQIEIALQIHELHAGLAEIISISLRQGGTRHNRVLFQDGLASSSENHYTPFR